MYHGFVCLNMEVIMWESNDIRTRKGSYKPVTSLPRIMGQGILTTQAGLLEVGGYEKERQSAEIKTIFKIYNCSIIRKVEEIWENFAIKWKRKENCKIHSQSSLEMCLSLNINTRTLRDINYTTSIFLAFLKGTCRKNL